MSRNLHDQNYRRLFSSSHMVRALFDGILPTGLRQQLDLNTLQALPTNFVSTPQRDRRADCVWRVPRREGEFLYLLILLEHQPQPDQSDTTRSNHFEACCLLLREYRSYTIIT